MLLSRLQARNKCELIQNVRGERTKSYYLDTLIYENLAYCCFYGNQLLFCRLKMLLFIDLLYMSQFLDKIYNSSTH